ncbi:MAG: tryptophan synthase subunit beta [Patescibacteria group bacterium]
MNKFDINPDPTGNFGNYGGQVLPPAIATIMNEIDAEYEKINADPEFLAEMDSLRRDFIGRPSPIYFCKKLSAKLGGARIFLKREDLNHTGAHKINHCIGEALLAKKMGKTKIIAETGAGQHGVALATAAALVGLPCEIFMGEVDIAKQAPNVTRMKILGAKVVPVSRGLKTLKEAVDAALEHFLSDPQNIFYAIGSVVGPHPFPKMVRDFQRVVGEEAREQFQKAQGKLPNKVIACVGGGSNAIGIFSAFLEDAAVEIIGVEPAGRGLKVGDHAATLTFGSPGNIHGMHTYLLQDAAGEPSPVYSIASGLDYPGIGPQHSFLKDSGRVQYATATDDEVLVAFRELSQVEGIIPALESAHALAYAFKIAPQNAGQDFLINLSGRGDKDIDFVVEKVGEKFFE